MSKNSAIMVEQLKECLNMHSSMPMCEKGTSRVGIIVVEQRSVGTYLAICREIEFRNKGACPYIL